MAGAAWYTYSAARDGCPLYRARSVGLRYGLLRARTLLLLVQSYGTIYLPSQKVSEADVLDGGSLSRLR